jgi:hypothetical protein
VGEAWQLLWQLLGTHLQPVACFGRVYPQRRQPELPVLRAGFRQGPQWLWLGRAGASHGAHASGGDNIGNNLNKKSASTYWDDNLGNSIKHGLTVLLSTVTLTLVTIVNNCYCPTVTHHNNVDNKSEYSTTERLTVVTWNAVTQVVLYVGGEHLDHPSTLFMLHILPVGGVEGLSSRD